MALTQIAFYCDQGCRDNLEDAFNALTLSLPAGFGNEVTIAIVTDGVGGNRFGEVASRQAADDVCSLLASFLARGASSDNRYLAEGTIRNLLLKSFVIANQRILRIANERPLLKDMATTIVGVIIANGTLHVAWAGDSRCYKYSNGRLHRLTTDHSEVQKLIDAGVLSPAYADMHPLAHVVNQFLGMPEGLTPAVTNSDLRPGDLAILCSDGLTDALSDNQIADVACRHQNGDFSFRRLPQYLVHLALDAGATDNITVLCCEYMPDAAVESRFLDFTLTGAYPVELAQKLRILNKEPRDD